MLIAASCPSKRLAAVTRRTGLTGTCSSPASPAAVEGLGAVIAWSGSLATLLGYPTVERPIIVRMGSRRGRAGGRLRLMALRFDPIEEARRQWVAHGWTEAAPGMAVVTSVVRAQQIFLARIDAELRPLGLTFARYELLMVLAFSRQGAMPLGRVGARLQVHPTSVTNAVDRLEAQGLIRRLPHATDRRTTLAEILPAGRELAEQATVALNKAVFEAPGLDGA